MWVVDLIFFTATSLLLLLVLWSSIGEREKRAAILTAIGIVVNSGLWLLFILGPENRLVEILNLLIVICLALFAALSLLRFFPRRETRDMGNGTPFDERDHMFSRNNLQFYPHLAADYYARYPEKRERDREIQNKPELGEPGSLFFDPCYSGAAEAAFSYLARTRTAACGTPAAGKQKIDPVTLTGIVCRLGRYYGAVDVGITALKPYHLYSHAGRRAENWGERIANTHDYAVVLVVAMDIEMIRQAPSVAVLVESSRQYVESAKIAMITAEYLRLLGFEARAHTDGNYETLCVPLAVDAGLGELGRMSLLMHRQYGPCVRLSVVTTDAPLVESEKKKLFIEEFCRICKKCADNCPSRAITAGEEPFSRGFRHWSTDQEKCYGFWKRVGTDCGVCIRACPYTKPDTLFHRLVRFYISRNPLNQRIALFFDDLLYRRLVRISTRNRRQIWNRQVR
jgi:reductive dehalogenase